MPSDEDGSREKRARWRDEIVTEVFEFPRVEADMKAALFYNKLDYQIFQEKEQKRYDKMMMKQIQNLVREAMADQLQEAMDRGASPEELETMMPQTTEEIFALLGGMPAAAMPPPPKSMATETIHKSHAKPAESPADNSRSEAQQEDPVEYSDDAIVAMFSVDEGKEESKKEEANVSRSPLTSAKKNLTSQDASEDEICNEAGNLSDRTPPDRDDSTIFQKREEASGVGPTVASDSHATGSEFNLSDDPSLDGSSNSVHEELNERLGTSISSEMQVEDLLPMLPLQEEKPNVLNSNLDEWTSSDGDEGVVPDDENDDKLESELRSILPQPLLDNSRDLKNKRDSKAIAKRRIGEKKTLQPWDELSPPKEKCDTIDIVKTDEKTDNELTDTDIESKTVCDSQSNRGISAKVGAADTAVETEPVVTTDTKARREKIHVLPMIPDREVSLEQKDDGEEKAAANKMWGEVVKQESKKKPSLVTGTPPGPRRKLKERDPSLPETPSKPRSASLDGKRKKSKTRERRAGRKESSSMERSKANRILANSDHNGDWKQVEASKEEIGVPDHTIVIENGKRTTLNKESYHSTRRSEKKKREQRKDYEVHGGWGNPLDLGAVPRARQKTSSKKVEKTLNNLGGSGI